jgi:hypothetical protein
MTCEKCAYAELASSFLNNALLVIRGLTACASADNRGHKLPSMAMVHEAREWERATMKWLNENRPTPKVESEIGIEPPKCDPCNGTGDDLIGGGVCGACGGSGVSRSRENAIGTTFQAWWATHGEASSASRSFAFAVWEAAQRSLSQDSSCGCDGEHKEGCPYSTIGWPRFCNRCHQPIREGEPIYQTDSHGPAQHARLDQCHAARKPQEADRG